MEYDMTMIQGSAAATAKRRKALLTLAVKINIFFAETLFTLSVKFNLYYRLSTKLREGNVFTPVCLFIGEGVWCYLLSSPMFFLGGGDPYGGGP